MKNAILHSICFLSILPVLWTQPVLDKVKEIEGLKLYGDLHKVDFYYYAPPSLILAKESNGRPKFKLVQLRYTGSQVTADQGESRFMNLIQLTVTMPTISNRVLQKVRGALPGSPKLRPIPLKWVEGYLVTALGGEFRRLGEASAFEQSSHSQSLWTERNFTLRLNNFDAQILWEQVQSGKLALSLNFTYYADFVAQAPALRTNPDSIGVAQLDNLVDDLKNADTILSIEVLRSDAFPIHVNIDEYPELIQKIDVNESMNIAYPFLEVRCYDFTHDLRPDLAIKYIELEAEGVRGGQLRLPKISFFKNRPDQYVHQVQFDRAIRLNSPYRYRVTEISLEGKTQVSDWTTRSNWIGQLDITTPEEENPIEKIIVDIETEATAFQGMNVEKLIIQLDYTYRKMNKRLAVQFDTESTSFFKSVTMLKDKGSMIKYRPVWVSENLSSGDSKLIGTDNYIFVNIPEKLK